MRNIYQVSCTCLVVLLAAGATTFGTADQDRKSKAFSDFFVKWTSRDRTPCRALFAKDMGYSGSIRFD